MYLGRVGCLIRVSKKWRGRDVQPAPRVAAAGRCAAERVRRTLCSPAWRLPQLLPVVRREAEAVINPELDTQGRPHVPAKGLEPLDDYRTCRTPAASGPATRSIVAGRPCIVTTIATWTTVPCSTSSCPSQCQLEAEFVSREGDLLFFPESIASQGLPYEQSSP